MAQKAHMTKKAKESKRKTHFEPCDIIGSNKYNYFKKLIDKSINKQYDHLKQLPARLLAENLKCYAAAFETIDIKNKTIITAAETLEMSMECIDNPNYITAIIAISTLDSYFYLLHNKKLYIMEYKNKREWKLKQKTIPKFIMNKLLSNQNLNNDNKLAIKSRCSLLSVGAKFFGSKLFDV